MSRPDMTAVEQSWLDHPDVMAAAQREMEIERIAEVLRPLVKRGRLEEAVLGVYRAVHPVPRR